jgi:mycofactocin system glycosyltransferase
VLRLSPAGADALDRILSEPPGAPGAGSRLAAVARRLVDAGVADPLPGPTTTAGTPVTWSVVIPVRDRTGGLAATLAGLGVPAGVEVVVVDDASADPAATEDVVRRAGPAGARTLRRPTQGGPAAARNSGWRVAGGEVIVFVDADCTPTPGWHEVLLAHFGDAGVVAVAPRVASRPGPSVLDRYEAHRSPLDLGPDPALVRPGAGVAYVPSAAMAVRRSALDGAGGFDDAMRTGEDVDLVWRLASAGGRVRYEPAAVVEHPPRATWRAWLSQRVSYGASAGPLARRHGSAVAPARLVWPGSAVWALAVAAGVGPGAAGAAAAVAVAARRLRARTGLPGSEATRLAALAQLRSGPALGEALRRPWWPATAAALLGGTRRGRWRLRLLALVLVPLVPEWVAAGRPVGLPQWLALRLADDLAYGCGLWAGCVRSAAPAGLLPHLVRQSPTRPAVRPGATPPRSGPRRRVAAALPQAGRRRPRRRSPGSRR